MTMTEPKGELKKLMDIVTAQTTFNQLREIVGKLITPEDLKSLGGDKTNAAGLVADSIAYLGAFAPAPAIFDENAFFATGTLGLSEDVARRVLEINKRIGVIKDEPTIGKGRMSVSAELVSASQNQFLSED